MYHHVDDTQLQSGAQEAWKPNFFIFISMYKDEKLSPASKMTLEHQRGPMSKQEVLSFNEHALKDVVLRMRNWDEQAKQPNKYKDELSASLALQVIERRLSSYLHGKN